MIKDDLVLPQLRQELRLEPAVASLEGIPRWRLYDPLQHRYFFIGEADVALLAQWSAGTVGALRRALGRKQQALDEAALEGLMRFLGDHHLLQTRGREAVGKLADLSARQRGTGVRGVVNRFMALRVPLWDPHPLIERVLPWVRMLGHRSMLTVWAALTVLGLYLTSRQWDAFIGTFSDFFSPAGLLAYGCALLGLKVIHELGHAYMAITRGCRVGSMGVSIFMGLPMLYTELGDVARLDDHRQRMWVAAGGVMAETLVAGLATLAWAVFPEGAMRSTAFVVATSSLATSLFINLNPLTRFDGYYFFADALKIENLQPRALAYNQWLIGRLLFGPVEDAPEPATRGRALFYAVYGTLVWLYQIALSCGIAWLAYKTLFTAAGLLVLTYALWHFLGRRLQRSVQHLWGLRTRMQDRRRLILAGIAGGMVLLACAPLDRHITVPVMLGWNAETPIQAPENARIEAILATPGQPVRKGDVIMRFYSPELENKQAKAKLDLTIATERLDRIGGDSRDRADVTVLLQQQRQAQADLEGLAERARMLDWRAPDDGLLVDVPVNLQAGMWVRPDMTLGRVLQGPSQDARGYITEKDMRRLIDGAEGTFIADEPSQPTRKVRLTAVDTSASEFITPDSLSSRFGGPIASQANDRNRSVPLVAQHRASFSVAIEDSAALPIPMRIRGEIELQAQSQSLAGQVAERLWQLTIAELSE